MTLPGVGIPGARRRRATIAALAAGWVLIAGGTAGAVVAVGRGHTSQSAVGKAAPPAAGQTSSAPTPTPTPSPSSSSPPSPSPDVSTSSPSPSSTVTGKVAKGVHSGDIRYFLLAVPADGSTVGTPDGDTLTATQVAALYSNSSSVLKSLQELNYKDGAQRHYQTGDGKYHVWVRLFHFATADGARLWALGDKPPSTWTEFAVPGYPDEKAYEIPLDASTGEARLRAVGFRGDVFFEIDVFGEPPVDHAVLIDRVRKQITRLDSGS